MSSTNQTTNYHLSQYIGTDKPTYLGDYNGDMLKIDNAIKGNADDIATNANAIVTAQETATTALNKANTIDDVSATATNALNKANSNEAKIVGLESYTHIIANETLIGKLGTKNLYRKIITYTQSTATSGSGLVQVDIPTGISSVTRVYNVIGNYDSDGSGIYNTVLPNFTSTGGILSINAVIIGTTIDVRLRAYNHAINANTEFEIVIEYTKD